MDVVRPTTTVIASALRKRFALSRPLSDFEVLKLGLGLALGAQAESLVKYSHSREILVSLPENVSGLTDEEWFSLFSFPKATNPKLAIDLAKSPEFEKQVRRMRSALCHTLQEPGLQSAFEQPLSKLLIYLALNTPADGCTERVEAVIGSVVRTDRRSIEDLREECSSGACELMLLGQVVEAVVSGII